MPADSLAEKPSMPGASPKDNPSRPTLEYDHPTTPTPVADCPRTPVPAPNDWPVTPTLLFPPSVDPSTPYTPERPPFLPLGLKVVPPSPFLLFELPSTPSPTPVLKPA